MQIGIDNLVAEYVALWVGFNILASISLTQLWAHMHKRAVGKMARRRCSAIAALLTAVVLVTALIAPVGVIAVLHPGLATGVIEYLTASRLFLGVFLLYVLFMVTAGWWYTGAHLPDDTPESAP